jgi:bifunctional UDP-N-acetylglucosamine pyrophosphorylase/glucosamine-1-phosphate N-acetyltransferase
VNASPLHVIILAAGQGTRMRSRLPKVVHPVLGRPLVMHVVDAVMRVGTSSVVLVVPPEHETLRNAVADAPVRFAIQDPPRGTGDAAAQGMAALGEADGQVLVINGDCPGIRPETLTAMRESHAGAAATFLTVSLPDPTGYGRMLRDPEGNLLRIIEEPDCTPAQRAITEVNAGLYLFEAEALRTALADLRPDNAQGELYLTDTLEAVRRRGGVVNLYHHDDAAEVHGVNTRVELARAEELLRTRKLEALMLSGVTIRMPHTVSVDVDVEVGRDTVLCPGVVLESGTRIGERCAIHPNVRIARSAIGDGVTVFDGSVVEDSAVESNVQLGPFARLRPGASIGSGARVGNFVEIKATRLGPGAKASHLTYLGDADVGPGANIGAGTITCNYDGERKHPTTIGEGAFIGSNTALVAPVTVGRGAYIGAGSTITKDVPEESLGVARGRQVTKKGWARRRRDREEES